MPMQNLLPKKYSPREVEDKIYQFWEKSGLFKPKINQKKNPFVIVIPPPNVTGSLHMGHALNATIQDILIRQRRMQALPALWVPGTDHAGIATQNVVEKELAKENRTRFDLGREKFIRRIWQWREKYGHIIIDQLKKLGCSCDWSRERFTMDEDYSEAVKKTFLHYQKRGWVYQGERVINWCPRCQTSLSDLELEYKEIDGRLWYVKYKIKNIKQNSKLEKDIIIATTRPETMLGDTAVAVNPEDKRYLKLVNQKIILPLISREIPIVADKSVDPEFGTGAVKVTPAHDQSDFEIGEQNNLPKIKVIDEAGKITQEAGKYTGLDRFKAREKILDDLEKLGLLIKTENYTHQIPHCYRCETIIEQLPSKQWFVKMGELAKPAVEAVKKDKIKFIPPRWKEVYLNWMTNLKDWCVSRQIWWGHRLPIWYCGGQERANLYRMGFHNSVVPQVFAGKTKTYRLRNHFFRAGDLVAFENSQTGRLFGYGKITAVQQIALAKINLQDKTHGATYKNIKELIAAFRRHYPKKEVDANTEVFIYSYQFRPINQVNARNGCGEIVFSSSKPKKCPTCNSAKLVQSEDVLDTWFSSALWPFAVFLKKNGSKLKLKTKNEKLSDLDYFYPTTILTTAREILLLWVARMIFSGLELTGQIPFQTVYIHPVVLAESGRRMSKSLGTGVDPLKLIEKYGADATRFGIAWQLTGLQDLRFKEDTIIASRNFCNKVWNAARFVISQTANSKLKNHNLKPQSKTQNDKEILNQLHQLTNSINPDLENFRFGKAAQSLYHFFWHEFCDKYIEISKSQIQNPKSKESTQIILLYVLENSLKLLHPFMPFITEEIWQKLPGGRKPLIVSEWPE